MPNHIGCDILVSETVRVTIEKGGLWSSCELLMTQYNCRHLAVNPFFVFTVFAYLCYFTGVRDSSAAVAIVDPERKDRTGAVKQILSSLLSIGGNTTIQVPL